MDDVLYMTTTPHLYQNINMVPSEKLGESWHPLRKNEKKERTPPRIKVGLSPSRGDSFVFFFQLKKNRPVLDKTVPCGVQVLGEMKSWEARGFLALQAAAVAAASPPSCSASTSAGVEEAPVKQEAEQGCTQAPPQRPLVPLVSTILKQQTQQREERESTGQSTTQDQFWPVI